MKLNLLSILILGPASLIGLPANARVLDNQCEVTGLDKANQESGRERHPIEDWLEQSKDPTSTHPLTKMTIDELLDELIACQDALAPAKKRARPVRPEPLETIDI